ncbi:MAG: permease [Candidatus Omnitrophica bacterium CG11_big_fil_rev_8_21_14_0_20_45_26]|uniref:Probable membrane transporter protein n=1 Tax=Candidatus Abzuiibacterium crystallinum TaxID=1974748 RepID=A0A2H0LRQ5_9BACT|nr:MAG: permease [Candidatus Omnitrophica bacterium CG11_big_fil_rev_8_21_14_0_20_45_26]PIW65719.1 MAG: permease [Candidatus Omnitrophica bacterium CG12_big_fil_rev_8_21_14_0_65_45_16]
MTGPVIIALTIVISLFGGIVSALLGVGGGLIFVPLFHYVLKLDMHHAVGTSLAIIIPTAFVGAWKHELYGFIDWRVLLSAVLFAVIGGFIGAQMSVGMDTVLLKKIFAVFLVIVAIRMWL